MHARTQSLAILAVGLLATSTGWAQLSPYSTDFESAPTEGNIGDGWINAINQFNPDGSYNSTYQYNGGPAPAAGPQVSAIALEQGGPTQGAKVLSVYSDYDNLGFQGNGNPDAVETNVFQERFLVAGDTGNEWLFAWDAKAGNLESPATALGFIKVFNASFGLLAFETVDMTNISSDWTRYETSVVIPELVGGERLQFGFLTSTGGFVSSGNFYDNVNFLNAADVDGDGVLNDADNCTEIANINQIDADGDGFGNLCDGDFNNSCSTDLSDLFAMRGGFLQVPADPDLDLDSSGAVNITDLFILRGLYLQPPGPSGLASCP